MRIEAEANLSALIESTEDLIWSVDPRYRLITFNRAFSQYYERRFGGPVAPGMGFRELLPPELAAPWPPFYDRALRGEKFRIEFPLTDGRILELVFNPIIVEGKTTGVSVFGKDITERKIAESAIKKAEANLTALIESTGDLIWSVDLDYRLVTFNRALQQNILEDYGVQLVAGMVFHEVLPPERAALWPAFYARVLEEGPFRLEYTRIDGGIMELTFNPVVVEGKPTGISVFGKEITERKRAMLALHDSEARFHNFFEQNGSVMILVEPETGLIVAANRAASKYYGYSQEQLIGMNVDRINTLPPDEVALERQRALSEEHNFFNFRHRLASGEVRDVEVYSSPVEADGRRLLFSTVHDVTERNQAAKALAESEVRFRSFFEENSSVMFIVVPESGEFVAANRAACEFYGYPKERLIGMFTSQISLSTPKEIARDRQLALRKECSLFYYSHRLASGEVREVELHSSPFEVDGRQMLYAIVNDITERKKAELALREAEAKYRTIFDEALEGIFQTTIAGQVLVANPAVVRMLGYDSLQDFISSVKNTAHDVWVFPKERARYVRQLQKNGVVRGFECQFKRKDGSIIWATLSTRKTVAADGRTPINEGFIEDITERKRTEAALRESLDSLQESQAIGGLGSYVLDIGTGVWTGSDVMDEIFGISKEYDHTLAGWKALIHPHDRAMIAAYFTEEVVGKGLNFDKEYRILRPIDQAERWVHGIGRLEFDGNGQPVKMRGVIKDITESKLSEVQRHDSEERYRAAFQMNQDSIDICYLENGRFIEVNEAFVRCTGYTREDVIGRTAQEIGIWITPPDRQKLLEALRQNQGRCNFETPYRTKNGDLRWGLLSVAAIELDGLPCILSITRDITDAKAAEERLATATDALRASEKRYHTAFQTSLDAININRLDDGRFIDCNQAFLDMEGYEREEVIGRTSLELNVWADARDRKAMVEILRGDSRCRGLEIRFRKKNGEIYWGELSASLMEIDGVPCILSITRDLSSAKAAENTIRSLAFFDPLTGLPNRRHLMERLHQPRNAGARYSRSQALLLVDLDHFKTLNDTLGHQTGDLLLQEVARRIVACAHEADTVCRLGGDEFVVVLEDLSKVAEEAAAQAQAVSEKILAAIDRPCLLEDHECLSTASIGIAVFGYRQGSTDEILQQAEIALYQAKAAGRNTLRFFSPALQALVNARAAMEEDLRQGIKEKQFLLYYQPQVERGRVTGAEALVRWMHPRRGLVMPNDFIPLAEESRLILPLGDWVLEAACAQIALWAGRKETAYLSVAVNISALQFRQTSFVEQVLATLISTGANPGNLRLELTESMLVDNLDDIIAKMNELKSHGLRFSLDDFGTGYSSLTYLKRLPLDRLKIDRSFVHDMLVDATSGAIAQTILSLGRAMGISVIAEGVETEEQRGYLAGLGCHSFQGFLFSRPLPLEKFEAFMEGFPASSNAH